MAKTIKQIADEIGVSRQSIYKKIKSKPLSTKLSTELTTVDNKLTVSVNGERLIKSAFLRNGCQPVDSLVDTSVDSVSTELTAVIEVLQATIDTLQEQLTVKDKQIEQFNDLNAQLNNHLTQLTAALENTTAALTAAQALHAADKQQELIEAEAQQGKPPKRQHWWQRKKTK